MGKNLFIAGAVMIVVSLSLIVFGEVCLMKSKDTLGGYISKACNYVEEQGDTVKEISTDSSNIYMYAYDEEGEMTKVYIYGKPEWLK